MGEATEAISYHQGFYGAAELEFRLERAEMTFYREYNLSKEPQRIDILVVVKEPDVQIENEVGKFFKQHNVIEYKSPDDGLTIDDLFKTIGYACQYKALGETVDQIPEDQITVSLFRDTYPRRLFKALEESGRTITQPYPGIYYVKGHLQFDTQIVVISQLTADRHSALRVLSNHAKEADVRRFLTESAALKKQGDRHNIDAVLQVSVQANGDLYGKIRRDDNMSPAFEELMQDVIEEKVEERVEQRVEEVRKEATLEAARKVRLEAIVSMMKNLNYTEEKAMDTLEIPAEERSMYMVWLTKI